MIPVFIWDAMRTQIIKIGNSQGIRIPKPLREESGIESEVELSLVGKQLVIVPVHPRVGWESLFAKDMERIPKP